MVRDRNASRLFSAKCEYVREVMRFRGGERGWGVSQVQRAAPTCSFLILSHATPLASTALHGTTVLLARTRSASWSQITCPKSFKLIFTDVETCQPKKEVALHDIIPRENIAASLCKFLTCHQGRIYITDLGLNLVYVFNLEESDVMVSRLELFNVKQARDVKVALSFIEFPCLRYLEVMRRVVNSRTQPAWCWTGGCYYCTVVATVPLLQRRLDDSRGQQEPQAVSVQRQGATKLK